MEFASVALDSVVPVGDMVLGTPGSDLHLYARVVGDKGLHVLPRWSHNVARDVFHPHTWLIFASCLWMYVYIHYDF